MTHREATPSHGTGADPARPDRPLPRPPGADRTERELRDALSALAGGVLPDPDAYRAARGTWLRRERRRRLVLAVLVAVVFALAVLIGLWVLNQAPAEPGVIFSGTGSPSADGPSLPRLPT
ncbi:hypothetical protein [Streptomyces sp. NPDC029526]|uniref:hypothetical protein n=1 Tax=Streptomyces sp. NPDC029526 TaxID=3155728 RepID=UPI0033DF10B5